MVFKKARHEAEGLVDLEFTLRSWLLAINREEAQLSRRVFLQFKTSVVKYFIAGSYLFNDVAWFAVRGCAAVGASDFGASEASTILLEVMFLQSL